MSVETIMQDNVGRINTGPQHNDIIRAQYILCLFQLPGAPGLLAFQQHNPSVLLHLPTASSLVSTCLSLHTVSSCVTVSKCPSSPKDTSCIGLRPTLMISSELDEIHKGYFQMG